jgi:phytoene dehydrogenase-like protein
MVDDLDPALVRRARSTTVSPYSLMTALYALREAPRFDVAPEASSVAIMNCAPASIESYLRIFDDLRYGDLPRTMCMAAIDHARWDPTRAPAGGGTLAVGCFSPYAPREGGAAAFDERKSMFRDFIHEKIGALCTNLTEDNIVGSSFLSPVDAERYMPTFQHGDVGGISKGFYQIGGHRPTPELSQYAVPGAEGLYLAGAFMHPRRRRHRRRACDRDPDMS